MVCPFSPYLRIVRGVVQPTKRAEVALREKKRCGVAGVHGIVFLSEIRLTIEKDFRRLRHVSCNLWTHWGSNSSLEKRPVPGQGVT